MKFKLTRIDKGIAEELLQLLANQARRAPIPVFFAALTLIAFAANKLSPFLWGSWFVLAIIMLGVRWRLIGRLPELVELSTKQRLQLVFLLNAIHGLLYAATLYAFPYYSEIERAIQSVILLALCTASISTTAGYLPLLAAYAVPIFFCLSAAWAFTVGYSDNQVIEYMGAILVLLYSSVLISFSKDTFKLFKESYEIRLQQKETNKLLQQALKDAEAANQSKTRFFASASHDLRQPLHSLSLFGAALELQKHNSQSQEIIKHLNIALKSLAAQLDALLDISKLDANVIDVDLRPINIKTLLSRISLEMEPLAQEKKLDLQLSCHHEYFVETDIMLFERIIRNLVSNAIKYTDTGNVTIQVKEINNPAKEKAKRLIIDIIDSGRGISSDKHKEIFDEFFQVGNTERSQAQGLGLGLSIVKRLTNLLNIELSMTSILNEGSVFSLDLPVVLTAETQQISIFNDEQPWHKLSVLVIDDEIEIGIGMEMLLKSLGCKPMVCDSTASALAIAKQKTPDIVLADFRLRGNDTGILSIEKLREIHPNLPAILITGDKNSDTLKQANTENLQVLYKPVMPSDLKQAIIQTYKHQNKNDKHHNEIDKPWNQTKSEPEESF
ncbi:MAG: hybrid sensor histidine kinase/response regulator [Pseudomonadales bacterium]|nr:hybrid sensor histidine kinase/response regulator [Pseudomonadales bacterium]